MHQNRFRKTIVEKGFLAFLFFFASLTILFTLFAGMPLDEDPDPKVLSIDPEGMGLQVLSGFMSISFAMISFVFLRKYRSKFVLFLMICCLFISSYRMIAIGQYEDHCQYVESSVCVIEEEKILPLW